MIHVGKQILQALCRPHHRNLVECILPKSYSSLVKHTEVLERRNYLFTNEQKRQLEEVGRIEKISVNVNGPPEEITLIMNKEVSTPFDCCKHISQGLCQQSPLALVNDTVLWDMHRPLEANCNVKFLTFKDKNPHNLNKVFWRTGSFILGAVVSKSFKEEITVHLHSFPPPYLRSGSFIYDVYMNLKNWEPSVDELKMLSAEFLTFVQGNHKIERLRVKKHVAAEIFSDNPFKSNQIPGICAKAEDHKITLYRVDDHIDISSGPMVGDTSFFGRCSVCAVHIIEVDNYNLYRFQGIALPKGILLNSYAYQIIHKRAANLNEAEFPVRPSENYDMFLKPPNPPNNSKSDVPDRIDYFELK